MAEDPHSTLRVDADTGGAQSEIKGLGGIFGGLFGTIAGGVVAGQALFLGLTAVVGVVTSLGRAFVGFIGDSMKMNATLQSTTLQFTTLMGDADAAKAHVRDLFEFAKRTPFETGPIILASRTLETFGGAALNTKENLTLFGDAAAATSAPIQEVSMWSGRLYASLQSGRPFGEAAQRLGELAIMTPRTRMELEAMQKAGASGNEIWTAYQQSLGKFTGAMEVQAETWGGLTSSISDSVQILAATAFEPFFEMAIEGLKTISDLLGSEGVSNAAKGMGQAFGDAFRIIRDAFGPVIKGFIETAKGAAAAADGSSVFGLVVKGIITIVATFMEALAGIVRAIATVIQAYFEFRIAGNLLLMAFGKVVEGILWGTLKIAEGMAKVSFGETRKSFERDAESLRGALAKVRTDITGLSENTEQYRQKSEATGKTLRGFADGLEKAAVTTRDQAAAYKYVAPKQDDFSRKTREITDEIDGQGVAAKKTKEKISDFANTATSQIGKLWQEWQRQPPAIRANAESVNILLDKYEKLRKDVTDKSKLPAELEMMYVLSGRAVPVIDDLGKAFKGLGEKIPIDTLAIKLPQGLKGIKEWGIPAVDTLDEAAKKSAKLKDDAAKAADEGIAKIIKGLRDMAQIAPGAFGAVFEGMAALVAGGKAAVDSIKGIKDGAQALSAGNILSGLGSLATGIGGIVSLAGAAWEGLKKLFGGKPDWQKIGSEITRDYGIHVSDALAKQIEVTAKQVKDRNTAILLNLSAVIKEAGGVTVANIDLYTKKTHDLFSAVETRKITLEAAMKSFNEVFPQLAKVIVENNGLANKSFLDLIATQERFGGKSKEVTEFVAGQIKSATTGMKAFLDNAIISNQQTAEAMGNAAAAMFEKVRKDSGSTAEALKLLNPIIAGLTEQFATTGFTGGAAFDQIKDLAATASNEIVSKAMTAVDGLNSLMRGLHNSGLMDQQMFAGLSLQVSETFNKLIAEGHNGDHVLRLMQPTLQTLHEMQRRFGLTTDESTQALLDQARASGVVGDQYMSAQDRMAAATDRVANAIEFMAGKMGYLPAVAENVASRVGSSFGSMERQVYSSESAFDRWRRTAISAANDVSNAVDEVSFGASPGGIKEWILLLAKSRQMFGEVSSTGVREINRLSREVNAFGSPGIGFDVAGTAGRMAVSGGGVTVQVDARGAIFEEEATVGRIANRVGEKIASDFYRGVKAHTTQ